jgi:hypothetical protein
MAGERKQQRHSFRQSSRAVGGSERLVAGDLKERLAPLLPDQDKRERELLLVRVISATLQGASDHQG